MLKRGNSRVHRQSNNARYVPLPVVAVSVLSCVLLFLLVGRNGEKSGPSIKALKRNSNSLSSAVKSDPTLENINGTDFMWQIPDTPKAVLFIAHGCNGKLENFWEKSSKCPNCIGFPEEKRIVNNALARKFAVIVVKSSQSCWTFEGERTTVKNIIESWVLKHNLEKLPHVALGASSGGLFVSLLATDMQFSSVTLMIAEGYFNRTTTLKGYPPTLFVYMPKDSDRELTIEKYSALLKGNGTDVAEIKCTEFQLSPKFLADRVQGLDLTTSEKLFTFFQDKGFVNKTGFMINDSRAFQWAGILDEVKAILPDMSLLPCIKEEMNLAYAFHEMTSLQSDQIFDWFESHMNKSAV